MMLGVLLAPLLAHGQSLHDLTHADAAFARGVQAFRAQDWPRAAASFDIAAGQGHPQAQLTLGAMYATGRGVTRDPVRAHVLFTLAERLATRDALRNKARANREAIAKTMTRDQLTVAQRRAANWIPDFDAMDLDGVRLSDMRDKNTAPTDAHEEGPPATPARSRPEAENTPEPMAPVHEDEAHVAALADTAADDGASSYVAQQLAKGREMLKRNRLMWPKDENAWLHFSNALKRDPHNAEAVAGLEEIAKRYMDLAEEKIALSRKNPHHAEKHNAPANAFLGNVRRLNLESTQARLARLTEALLEVCVSCRKQFQPE
ncbi:hypothetical protein MAIT1_00852 [Magnetofaba australis IT-1]|uniref:Sel1 repeat family protein n=2 Tax=Magnetofaba TaxID=1472292 RepID=A0A1Y2K0R8_9PROT|nr:hypothetical protein MAIT1_00852 [Magnetofaba australis IT-1]